MNALIKLGLGIVVLGFGLESRNKKQLTDSENSDTVQIPTTEAKSVPDNDESEN